MRLAWWQNKLLEGLWPCFFVFKSVSVVKWLWYYESFCKNVFYTEERQTKVHSRHLLFFINNHINIKPHTLCRRRVWSQNVEYIYAAFTRLEIAAFTSSHILSENWTSASLRKHSCASSTFFSPNPPKKPKTKQLLDLLPTEANYILIQPRGIPHRMAASVLIGS